MAGLLIAAVVDRKRWGTGVGRLIALALPKQWYHVSVAEVDED